MKTFQDLLTGMALALAVLGADLASAEFRGKVEYLGTISEEYHDGGYSAQFTVHITDPCDGATLYSGRWFIIRSGHMDGSYAHRGVHMKNAYSTLLAALLSGKRVEIGASIDLYSFAYRGRSRVELNRHIKRLLPLSGSFAHLR